MHCLMNTHTQQTFVFIFYIIYITTSNWCVNSYSCTFPATLNTKPRNMRLYDTLIIILCTKNVS